MSGPGPYTSGEDKGGSSSLNNDGSIHSTNYSDGHHTSWDEDRGNVSGVHSTDHETREITNHDTDSRGNPK